MQLFPLMQQSSIYGNFLYAFCLAKSLFQQGGFISSNGMLYNNISHLPITCILVVNYKYSNMHNTFPESRNISMYTSWTTRYIGNDNSNTYLCLFGRLHLDLCLLELLESLPMCSTSYSDSKDMFLSCSWSEILSKSYNTTNHI